MNLPLFRRTLKLSYYNISLPEFEKDIVTGQFDSKSFMIQIYVCSLFVHFRL